VFEVIGRNFDSNGNMAIYTFEWEITPPVLDTSAVTRENFGQKLVIAAGNWHQNEEVTVRCALTFTEQPQINNFNTMTFQTYAPPMDGEVRITPADGYLGETYTISIQKFTPGAADSLVYFDVYQAYEHEGVSIKGPQMNPETLTQKDTFEFIAENDAKLYVEVFNDKGETQNYVLAPWIVEQPAQECTTDVECPPPEVEAFPEEGSEEEAAEGGRRLQVPNPQARLEQTRPGNYSEKFVGRDGCTYTKSCVQPEYFFDYENRESTSPLVEYLPYLKPEPRPTPQE
jgi:hypothetical protein